MTLEYKPTSGFTINGKELVWGEDRQVARKQIGIKYVESDRVIDLASFTNGDPSQNLIDKKDIYGTEESAFSFFLNYDPNEKLESIEVYKCENLRVRDIVLKFGQPISNAAKMLSTLDETGTEVEGGEFLYPKLKISIADSEAMGADGNALYYFYAAANIDHLLE